LATAKAATTSPREIRGNMGAAVQVTDWPRLQNGAPDFAAMNSAQRQAYDTARLQQRFG
jgi:hypothetical protein